MRIWYSEHGNSDVCVEQREQQKRTQVQLLNDVQMIEFVLKTEKAHMQSASSRYTSETLVLLEKITSV